MGFVLESEFGSLGMY